MLHVRKRLNVYWLEGRVARHRIRLSLGTRHHDAALVLANRVERALAEGKGSQAWTELAVALPPRTFEKLAAAVGYAPKPQTKPTWASLVAAFTAHAEALIARSKMRPSTWARYQQTLAGFAAFLKERGIVALADITKAAVEDFKAWRIERMRARKHFRGGGGLALDAAILHRVFAYAVESEMLARNPVKLEGRPGDNPERGAQPFRGEQLGHLRQAAGDDLLAFLLLRWTGLRGSDAVSLCWEEIDWQAKEVNRLTEKRRKRVILPLHPELLFALETEFARRKPRPDEPVLLNPATGKPLSRPRLYARMQALGRRAGVSNTHPHRFRDTFAVDMLLRGASPFDVAKLLGDTVQTIERHYAPYVRELRERARRLMLVPEGLEEMGTNLAQSPAPRGEVH